MIPILQMKKLRFKEGNLPAPAGARIGLISSGVQGLEHLLMGPEDPQQVFGGGTVVGMTTTGIS